MQQRMPSATPSAWTSSGRAQTQPGAGGAWNQFSAAMQPPAPDARSSRADFARLSTPERIDLMQKRADRRHARMKQRGDATKAFYAQLTPEQQKSFDSRAQRAGRGEGWHGGHGEHRGWGRGMGTRPTLNIGGTASAASRAARRSTRPQVLLALFTGAAHAQAGLGLGERDRLTVKSRSIARTSSASSYTFDIHWRSRCDRPAKLALSCGP